MKIYRLVLGTLFVIFSMLYVNESSAIVSASSISTVQNSGTVTGTYKGYKGYVLYLQLNDGTITAYPFRYDKNLLRQISKTRLSTTVTITIEGGIVTSFEGV